MKFLKMLMFVVFFAYVCRMMSAAACGRTIVN